MTVGLGAPFEAAAILTAGRIRRAIERGELHAGDQLPGEQAMADALQVSRNPIERALRILRGERLVESRPGQGWFVLAPTPPPTGDD